MGSTQPTTEQLLKVMTLEEKISLTAGINFWGTPAIPRLGIGAAKVGCNRLSLLYFFWLTRLMTGHRWSKWSPRFGHLRWCQDSLFPSGSRCGIDLRHQSCLQSWPSIGSGSDNEARRHVAGSDHMHPQVTSRRSQFRKLL